MVEKISVQIQLEGAAEIERQLAGVGKAGQQCFADITKAAEQAGGFAKLDPTVLAAKFKQFGISASEDIAKISKAAESATRLEATTLGVAELERGFGRAAASAGQATAAFGLTRREIGALGRAFRAANLGVVGSQLALIGRVGGAFGPVGIGLTAIAVGIAAVVAGLGKFATQASETEKALTQLQKLSGQSFENLSALSVVFAQGGTSAKQFASDFGNLFEKIQTAREQAAIRGIDEDLVKWANDVPRVRRQIDNIANGARVTFSAMTSLDTKVQAVLESLAKTRTAEEAWKKLADIMKNLPDLERARIGKGLGLSPEEISTLSLGSAKIAEMEAEAKKLGLTLTTGNQQALQQMAQDWNQFTALLAAFFQKMGALAAPAFAGIFESAKQAMAGIIADFQNLPLDQAIANLGTRLEPGFTALSSILSPILIQLGNALGVAMVGGIIAGVRSSLPNLEQELTTNLMIFIDNILRLLAKAGIGPGGQLPEGFGTTPGAPSGGGFAGGGLLGGRGTGTSDSNLAWVSRGEHIMPARTVAQPGVLALLEALRRSGGNLAGVLDGMGRFALGGMVPRPRMAFAGGGMVGGHLGTLTLGLPSGDSVSVRASSNVVDQLRKEAALAQVRSGGRKPSRYS